jgi:outer membrane protein assembly factor BamB
MKHHPSSIFWSLIVSKNFRLALMVVLLVAMIGLWVAAPTLRSWYAEWTEVEVFNSDPALIEKLKGETLPTTTPAVATGDWSQWRGPNRDGIATEEGLAKSWPESGPSVLWKVPGGLGYASISVAGDQAYTIVQDGEDEVILCLAVSDGAVRWRHRYPAKFRENLSGIGPRSTPTVADGRVYVVGATGRFHCLEASSGKVLWEKDFVKDLQASTPEYGFTCSPLVEGDLVYVITGAPNGGSCVAYQRIDGKLVWKNFDDTAGYSSPVAATIGGRRQIIFLTGQSLRGVLPEDGKELWRVPWKTQQDINAASPIVIGSLVYISSGYNKGCALLQIAENAQGWSPSLVYEHNRMRNQFATSVLVGEHLYGFDDMYLACMELRTGKVVWKRRGFDKGSLLAVPGHLIVLGEYGQLALVETNPAKYQAVSQTALPKGVFRSMPSLAHGKLFVRDQESIYCLNLR